PCLRPLIPLGITEPLRFFIQQRIERFLNSSPYNLPKMLPYALFVNLDYFASLCGTMSFSHGVPPLAFVFWVNYITRFEGTMTLIVRKILYVIDRSNCYPMFIAGNRYS